MARDFLYLMAREVGWGLCILLPAIFKNAFDVYSFSIISNLFDSDKPCWGGADSATMQPSAAE